MDSHLPPGFTLRRPALDDIPAIAAPHVLPDFRRHGLDTHLVWLAEMRAREREGTTA